MHLPRQVNLFLRATIVSASIALLVGCKSSPEASGGSLDTFLISSIPADAGAVLYSNYTNEGMLALRTLYPKDAIANPFSAGIASLGDKNPDLAKSLETLLSMAPGSLLEQEPTIQKMAWYLSNSSVLTGVCQFKDEASITKARQALLSLKLQNIACTESASSPQALLCTLTRSAADKSAEPVAPTSIAICTQGSRVAVVVDGAACEQALTPQSAAAPVLETIPASARTQYLGMVGAFSMAQLRQAKVVTSTSNRPEQLASLADDLAAVPFQHGHFAAALQLHQSGGAKKVISTGSGILAVASNDPAVGSILRQITELSDKENPVAVPPTAALAIATRIPAELSPVLGSVAALSGAAIPELDIRSISCALSPTPEENGLSQLPGLGCLIHGNKAQELSDTLKQLSTKAITEQTGTAPVWEESTESDGVNVSQYVTPFGIGITLARSAKALAIATSKSTALELLKASAPALKQPIFKIVHQDSSPWFVSVNGAALEAVLGSLMDTAQMFGVDTSAVKSQTTWVRHLGNSLLVAGLTPKAKEQLGAGIVGGEQPPVEVAIAGYGEVNLP